MRLDYDKAVRLKKLEIGNLQKQQLKDSIRVALNELGDIHYKYGSIVDALQLWSRSHDNCSAKEDYFNCSKKITLASFECLNSSFLVKFATNMISLDDKKSIATTSMLGILDAIGRILQNDFYRAAKTLTWMDSLQSWTTTEISSLLST